MDIDKYKYLKEFLSKFNGRLRMKKDAVILEIPYIDEDISSKLTSYIVISLDNMSKGEILNGIDDYMGLYALSLYRKKEDLIINDLIRYRDLLVEEIEKYRKKGNIVFIRIKYPGIIYFKNGSHYVVKFGDLCEMLSYLRKNYN